MFDDLVESSKALLKQASELMDRLNGIVSEENQDRLERTLANFEKASAQLRAGAARRFRKSRDGHSNFSATRISRACRRSLTNLEQATSAIVPVAEDSRQVLADIRTLSENLDRISTAVVCRSDRKDPAQASTTWSTNSIRDSRDFRRLVLQIEREPQSLVFGRKPVQPGPGEPGFNGGRK